MIKKGAYSRLSSRRNCHPRESGDLKRFPIKDSRFRGNDSFLGYVEKLASFTLLLALPLAAQAREIPNIVISATRTPTPHTQLGSSVTVLTEEDFTASRAESVAGALRFVPGLSLSQSGGEGQTTGAFLRGAGSSHVLVLIDGVEAGDPAAIASGYDFGQISLAEVERIEILRGAQSTLYGSDAIGGVIHIFTKRGAGEGEGRAAAEYGRYNSWRFGSGAGGKAGNVTYRVGAERREREGFSAFNARRGGVEKDGFEQLTTNGQLGIALAENSDLRLSARYGNSTVEYDDFNADTALNETQNRVLTARAEGERRMGAWTHIAGLSLARQERETIDSFGGGAFDGAKRKADWLSHWRPGGGHTVSLGLEREEETAGVGTGARAKATTQAAMAQEQWQWGDLNLAAGGRVDDHDRFGQAATWRAAPAYLLQGTQTRFKASAGTGFKAPSLFQLYSIYGNTGLEPEESLSLDFGIEQALLSERLRLSATVFSNRISRMIDYDFATSRYGNIGKARSRGAEFTASLRVLPWLRLDGAYTWMVTEDKATGLELLRRPKHSGSLAMEAEMPGGSRARLAGRYIGERADIDFAFARARMPGFWVMDASGSYPLRQGLELALKCENLLDKRYEEVYGYGASGRAVFLALEAGF